MSNLFDAANAPTTEPHEFVIGDFVQWKREDIVGDYPVATHSATWVARTIDIHYDLDVSGVDPRSHAQIMVDKIESILEGKADADVASYSINGRSLTKMSFQDLTEARDFYKREYAKELRIEYAKNGEETGATIKVRF